MADKTYKWRLTTFGRKDTPCFRKAFEHIQTFHVVRNSEARVIDYDEYQDLIKKGEIRPAQSHWQIKENQVGIISLTEYESTVTIGQPHCSLCKILLPAGESVSSF
jgi:hypothetical protein